MCNALENVRPTYKAIREQRDELRTVLERYMAAYPAFRIKPEGAPGSQVREEQERLMALEEAAIAAIARATGAARSEANG